MDEKNMKLDTDRLENLREAVKNQAEKDTQLLPHDALKKVSGGQIISTYTTSERCPECGDILTYVKSYDEESRNPEPRIDEEYVCLNCGFFCSPNCL